MPLFNAFPSYVLGNRLTNQWNVYHNRKLASAVAFGGNVFTSKKALFPNSYELERIKQCQANREVSLSDVCARDARVGTILELC